MCIAKDAWLRCDIPQYRPHLLDRLLPMAAVSDHPNRKRDGSYEAQQHRLPSVTDWSSEEDKQKDRENRRQPFRVRGHAQSSGYRAGEEQCESPFPDLGVPI